jgi:hypothetical protein
MSKQRKKRPVPIVPSSSRALGHWQAPSAADPKRPAARPGKQAGQVHTGVRKRNKRRSVSRLGGEYLAAPGPGRTASTSTAYITEVSGSDKNVGHSMDTGACARKHNENAEAQEQQRPRSLVCKSIIDRQAAHALEVLVEADKANSSGSSSIGETSKGHLQQQDIVRQESMASVAGTVSSTVMGRSPNRGATLKSLTLAPHVHEKAATFAVTCEVLKSECGGSSFCRVGQSCFSLWQLVGREVGCVWCR